IATRGSPLALWQANAVAARLGGDAEIVVIKTEGDRKTDVPLESMAGRGVFTTDVQNAVLDGRADIAVHSAKDLPSSPELQVDGLMLACVPERADPRDCLVGSTLEALPHGATVGTGSARREALLHHLRPDLEFVPLRGNIATRLSRVGELNAVVGAVAALTRLGEADRIAEAFDPEVFVPQVAQGALAVECRTDDAATLDRLATIDDADAHRCVLAERAFLAELGGGCDAPVGAHARLVEDQIRLVGFYAHHAEQLWWHGAGDDPVVVGRAVARAITA
ncbi:MAG TPA: hydroxymethylbilane synthase, partial [Acidimicrobiales bacterium]|nr:hydroxymethylbilane synthase [Acidimicrobiales bacterium]